MYRLFVNSQLLRGVREPSDVSGMPEEKKALAIRAMRNAQRCIDICLRGENVKLSMISLTIVSQWTSLRRSLHSWAISNNMRLISDVCAAFAASFLLRIARLFPHELNLKKTAKDVEELAKVLAEGKSIVIIQKTA